MPVSDNLFPDHEFFFGYPPEVLSKMWDQAFPVLLDKDIGKSIIAGSSGGIGGEDSEYFYFNKKTQPF